MSSRFQPRLCFALTEFGSCDQNLAMTNTVLFDNRFLRRHDIRLYIYRRLVRRRRSKVFGTFLLNNVFFFFFLIPDLWRTNPVLVSRCLEKGSERLPSSSSILNFVESVELAF